jgi:hypothetical protein
VVATLFVLVVLSPFAYFLVPGLVNAKSLADSIMRKSGQGSVLASPTCKRGERDSDRWDCSVPAPGSDLGGANYRVSIGDWSCWDAVRTWAEKNDGVAWPEHLSGCVKVGNNVRILDRVFGHSTGGD